MSKSRIQTLQNQIRILKEQTIALEEKGRHDDELVEALTARLKSKGFLSDLRNSRVLKVLEKIGIYISSNVQKIRSSGLTEFLEITRT